MRRRALLFASFVLFLSSAGARAYAPAEVLFHLQDAEILESSGVAASSYSDDVLFTHNDSGDIARFFAVGDEGQTLATIHVTPPIGAADWEDMARGPGRDGKPALYFADIGDNSRVRPFVTVYEVPEPVVDTEIVGQVFDVAPSHVFNLVYPSPRQDAETLMVTPQGDIVIVTKSSAASAVLVARNPVDILPNLMTRVATLDLAGLGASSNFTTGGDISADGTKAVVRTYAEAFEWDLRVGDLGAAFGATPARIDLPATRQGEAICYSRSGSSLITTTEGYEAPVHILRG